MQMYIVGTICIYCYNQFLSCQFSEGCTETRAWHWHNHHAPSLLPPIGDWRNQKTFLILQAFIWCVCGIKNSHVGDYFQKLCLSVCLSVCRLRHSFLNKNDSQHTIVDFFLFKLCLFLGRAPRKSSINLITYIMVYKHRSKKKSPSLSFCGQTHSFILATVDLQKV